MRASTIMATGHDHTFWGTGPLRFRIWTSWKDQNSVLFATHFLEPRCAPAPRPCNVTIVMPRHQAMHPPLAWPMPALSQDQPVSPMLTSDRLTGHIFPVLAIRSLACLSPALLTMLLTRWTFSSHATLVGVIAPIIHRFAITAITGRRRFQS